MRRWEPEQAGDLSGRVALVTGANSGIGLETSRLLARQGAHVVLACRDEAKGERALAGIRASAPAARIELLALDLADLDSVAAASATFGDRHPRLDILVNNAGVMALPLRHTLDGFEAQFGTNHLGHFALTGRLLERLLAADDPRVVTVSSAAHWLGAIDFANLNAERGYHPWTVYAVSKLANLLFTLELQRRAEEAGAPLAAVAAHPGYAATELQQAGPRMAGARLRGLGMRLLNVVVAQDAVAGAWPVFHAAAMPGVRGGDYYGPAVVARGRPARARRSAAARDAETARRLWDISEELTGVRYAFG